MTHLSAAETEKALPFPQLVAQMEKMFQRIADPTTRKSLQCPVRLVNPLPDEGMLLAMTGSDEDLAITKIVTIHPRNVAPLPAVQSDVTIFNAKTGDRLCFANGNVVTARRTPSATVAGALRLCPSLRSAPRNLLVIGNGVQAMNHKAAFEAVIAVKQTVVCPRKDMNKNGFEAFDISTEQLQWADIVVTATSCSVPVISAEASRYIRDDAVVCSIGAFTPDMAELPPELVRRMSLIAVDTLEGCRQEAGDLIQAKIDFDRDVVDVSMVTAELRTKHQAKGKSGPMLYKAVGCALWDLAAAHCILENHAAVRKVGAPSATKQQPSKL